ncbi:MAG: hypothetical protein ACFBSE_12855 [Prochloraceae cyanobacterium]
MNSRSQTASGLLQNRYIIAVVQERKIAILSQLVLETIAIEARKILTLPMYDPSLFGIVHDRGEIIPLIAYNSQARASITNSDRETLIAIRLSHLAGDLQGVGLVVDRAIATMSKKQIEASDEAIEIWEIKNISQQIWRSKR